MKRSKTTLCIIYRVPNCSKKAYPSEETQAARRKEWTAEEPNLLQLQSTDDSNQGQAGEGYSPSWFWIIVCGRSFNHRFWRHLPAQNPIGVRLLWRRSRTPPDAPTATKVRANARSDKRERRYRQPFTVPGIGRADPDRPTRVIKLKRNPVPLYSVQLIWSKVDPLFSGTMNSPQYIKFHASRRLNFTVQPQL